MFLTSALGHGFSYLSWRDVSSAKSNQQNTASRNFDFLSKLRYNSYTKEKVLSRCRLMAMAPDFQSGISVGSIPIIWSRTQIGPAHFTPKKQQLRRNEQQVCVGVKHLYPRDGWQFPSNNKSLISCQTRRQRVISSLGVQKTLRLTSLMIQ